MAELNLLGQHTVICGLKGAGKSNFLQWLLKEHDAYQNSLVYDMCREHDSLNRYLPEHRNGKEARAEAGEVVDRFVTGNDRGLRPDLLVLEEATRYAPNGGGAPDQIMDLVDLARHYDTGILAVCRRLAKLDTTLVELADHIIVFALKGKNDKKRLNNEAPGAGDAAAELEPYEFLVIDGTRNFEKHSPVPEMDTTGRL
jgi:DNA helicase HerA-like ATPase